MDRLGNIHGDDDVATTPPEDDEEDRVCCAAVNNAAAAGVEDGGLGLRPLPLFRKVDDCEEDCCEDEEEEDLVGCIKINKRQEGNNSERP